MTIEESKYYVKQNLDGMMENPQVILDHKYIEAERMAIASLEAWEKVRQEIIYAAKHTNGYYEAQSNTYWVDLDKVTQIIDKHLQEIAESEVQE